MSSEHFAELELQSPAAQKAVSDAESAGALAVQASIQSWDTKLAILDVQEIDSIRSTAVEKAIEHSKIDGTYNDARSIAPGVTAWLLCPPKYISDEIKAINDHFLALVLDYSREIASEDSHAFEQSEWYKSKLRPPQPFGVSSEIIELVDGREKEAIRISLPNGQYEVHRSAFGREHSLELSWGFDEFGIRGSIGSVKADRRTVVMVQGKSGELWQNHNLRYPGYEVADESYAFYRFELCTPREPGSFLDRGQIQ